MYMISRATVLASVTITIGFLLAWFDNALQHSSTGTVASGFLSSLRGLSTTHKLPSMTAPSRTPVYFFSHGGPNIMFDKQHPAYSQLASIGKEITTKVKPSAIVVFSAHWQAGRSHIEVNTAETQPLIYDYYGFPPEYYRVQYPNKGSPELARKVIGLLQNAGIEAKSVKRGLDHGVFAGFMCAFNPKKNPLTDIPIVQVSLFQTDDGAQHIKLGKALSQLREENVQIIVSGMAVHNLRDFFSRSDGRPLPYAASFDKALKDAVETNPGPARDEAMLTLLKRPEARQAHPSFEHLLPIHIGVGAADGDKGHQTWTMLEGSMSWAQYRFGEVGA